MKIAPVIVGVVIGLVVLSVVAGYLFPREHTATSSVTIRHHSDSVWMVVRDFGATPTWWAQLEEAARVERSDGREAWRQVLKSGTIPLVIEVDDPPRRLVTRMDVPDDAAFGGTWTYQVTSVEGGSRVSVTEEGYINNPFFRFMSNVVFGMHGTMDSYLVALGRKFESEVTIEHR